MFRQAQSPALGRNCEVKNLGLPNQDVAAVKFSLFSQVYFTKLHEVVMNCVARSILSTLCLIILTQTNKS